MIGDILVVLFAFVLGYAVFLASAFYLAKWLLPKIEDEASTSHERIMRTVKDGRYVAQ